LFIIIDLGGEREEKKKKKVDLRVEIYTIEEHEKR
jgi:hypothetical protein